MGGTLYEWQNATGTKLIQNKNLLSETFINLITQANAGGYNDKIYANHIGARYIAASYTSSGNYRVPVYNPQTLPGGLAVGYNTDISIGQRDGRFNYGRMLSDSNYNIKYGAYCMDYMPRLYVKLQRLDEYLIQLRDSSTVGAPVWVYTSTGVYLPSGNGVSWGFSYNEPVDYTSFIEKASNYYVCSQLQFYTDKSDGTSQELVDSANISYGTDYGYNCKVDVFQPLKIKAFQHDNYEFFAFGYYSAFMSRYGLYNSSSLMYPSIMSPVGLHSAIITGATLLSPLYNPGTAPSTLKGWTTVPESPSGAVHFATKKDWETLLNAGGCPWSYNLDIVRSPDGKGLHKPTTPGQPDNPVDTGDGDGDNISDSIEYPNPEYTPNAYKRYWLTSGQVQQFKDFLFKGTFLDNVKRLWTDPAEYIIDLTYYPVKPDMLGFTGDLQEITVGDIASGVQGLLLPDNSQMVIYAGSVDITRYYNSYLDYEPYTSIDIFLPYIGVRSLNTSQIMGHTLCCAYYLDVNTLQITAALGLDGDISLSGGSLGNVLTQYTSSFGVRFPLSGTAANQMILNVVQQVAGVVSGAAALVGGVATGNVAAIAGGAATTAGAVISGGQTAPITYGSVSPMSGLYAPQIPYLIINHPILAEPEGYNDKHGYSSAYAGKVSEFTGYLECLEVKLNADNTMSETEQNAIISMLKGGIYV